MTLPNDEYDFILKSVSAHSGDLLGTYSTGTYSMGLRNPIEHYLALNFDEKVSNGDRAEDDKFFDYLTFLHEMCHLTHFMSTPIGLEYAQSVMVAYLNIDKNSPHQVPITTELNNSLSISLLVHENLYRELTPPQIAKGFSAAPGTFGWNIRYTPHHVSPMISELTDIHSILKKIRDSKSVVMPRMVVSKPYKEGHAWDLSAIKVVECNTATLFEGFAVATEIEAIMRYFPEIAVDQKKLSRFYFDFLGSRPDIYEMCWIVYYYIYELPMSFSWTMMKVLIDISLCFRPQTFPDWYLSYKKIDKLGYFVTPFDTFTRACHAAQKVSPITKDSPRDMRRYETEVTEAMGIPTTGEMVFATLEHAEELVLQGRDINDFSDGDFNRLPPLMTVLDHIRSLRTRIQNDKNSVFLMYIGRSSGLTSLYRLFENSATVFDLESGRGDFTHPRQMIAAAVGQSLNDIWREKRPMGCPMAQGRPFQCSLGSGSGICSFQHGDGSILPCPSWHFQRMFEPAES